MAKYASRSTASPDVRNNLTDAKKEPGFTANWMNALGFARILDKRLKALCVVVALLSLIGSPRRIQAQISPGPLARAHRDLNGPENCTRCHTNSVRERSFRCTECHREIAAELTQHRGLHSTYPQGGAPGSECVKCHSDHNGEDFALLHWTPTAGGFDHTKTGYVLDGKHVGVSCRACHTAAHISASERALLKTKDLNRTYFGLSPQCATCHEDKHQGRLGPNCSRCHNTSDWKSTRVDESHFDHSTTQLSADRRTSRHGVPEMPHRRRPTASPAIAGIAIFAAASAATKTCTRASSGRMR